jgi:hypothetical protein
MFTNTTLDDITLQLLSSIYSTEYTIILTLIIYLMPDEAGEFALCKLLRHKLCNNSFSRLKNTFLVDMSFDQVFSV